MRLSEKIIKLRKEKGLSQEEFGDKINVSRQAISKWESEQSQPEIEKIKEISKVFGVSIEYLLNDEITEEDKDNKKKCNHKIKKIIKKCLLAVAIVYIAFCLIKLVFLLIYYIKAYNIPEYENYVISDNMSSNNVLRDEHINEGKFILYVDETMQIWKFNNSDENNGNADEIAYVNYKKNQGYKLTYNKETAQYIYKDLELEEIEEYTSAINLQNLNNIRSLTLTSFPSIISSTINPMVTISIDDISFNITHKYFNGEYYSKKSFNSKTGFFEYYIIESDLHNYRYQIDFSTELEDYSIFNDGNPVEYFNNIVIE